VKNFGVSAPVAGAGVALAAGLLLGAAMRPQLAIGELAPQPLDAWPQELSPTDGGAADALAFAQYGGQLPDYVLGVDWLAAAAPPAEPAPAQGAEPAPDVGDETTASSPGEAAAAAPAHGTPATATATADTSAAASPTAADGAASTPPPVPALAIDETAPPPEATGDTSRHDRDRADPPSLAPDPRAF